jgi:hypothetical protein
MKAIETWIDLNVDKIAEDEFGFMDLTDNDIQDLTYAIYQGDKRAFVSGLLAYCDDSDLVGIDFGRSWIGVELDLISATNYVYYLADMNKEYFQKALADYSKHYAEQERETHKVEMQCQ